MKDDSVYLQHILECIHRVEGDTSKGKKHFLGSTTHQDAVLRNLQAMSESTQRVSDSAKALRPNVEWEKIAAFRNVLVHNYLGIDLEQIWSIVNDDVPTLKQAILEIIEQSQ